MTEYVFFYPWMLERIGVAYVSEHLFPQNQSTPSRKRPALLPDTVVAKGKINKISSQLTD